MIRVNVEKDKIRVSGHAGYKEAGKDIVCAAVSSMVTTTVNAIIRLEKDSILYTEADGMVEIEIKEHSTITDTLILNMVELLKQLESQFSKYIKIK